MTEQKNNSFNREGFITNLCKFDVKFVGEDVKFSSTFPSQREFALEGEALDLGSTGWLGTMNHIFAIHAPTDEMRARALHLEQKRIKLPRVAKCDRRRTYFLVPFEAIVAYREPQFARPEVELYVPAGPVKDGDGNVLGYRYLIPGWML